MTSYEAGNANLAIPDNEVLEFAHKNNRIIVTFNRKDFIQLHKENPNHSGIVVCTEDKDYAGLAKRIDAAIKTLNNNTKNQLIRINRPNLQ